MARSLLRPVRFSWLLIPIALLAAVLTLPADSFAAQSGGRPSRSGEPTGKPVPKRPVVPKIDSPWWPELRNGHTISEKPPAEVQPARVGLGERVRPIAVFAAAAFPAGDPTPRFPQFIAVVPTTAAGFRGVFGNRPMTAAFEAALRTYADCFRQLGATVLPETAGREDVVGEVEKAAKVGAPVILVGHSMWSREPDAARDVRLPNGQSFGENEFHELANKYGIGGAVLTCCGKDFGLRDEISMSDALDMCREGLGTFAMRPGTRPPKEPDVNQALLDVVKRMRTKRAKDLSVGIVITVGAPTSDADGKPVRVVWESILIRRSPIGPAVGLAVVGMGLLLFGFWRTDRWLAHVRETAGTDFRAAVQQIAFAHHRHRAERWAFALIGLGAAGLTATILVEELNWRPRDLVPTDHGSAVTGFGAIGLAMSILAALLVRSYPYTTRLGRIVRGVAAFAGCPVVLAPIGFVLVCVASVPMCLTMACLSLDYGNGALAIVIKLCLFFFGIWSGLLLAAVAGPTLAILAFSPLLAAIASYRGALLLEHIADMAELWKGIIESAARDT